MRKKKEKSSNISTNHKANNFINVLVSINFPTPGYSTRKKRNRKWQKLKKLHLSNTHYLRNFSLRICNVP